LNNNKLVSVIINCYNGEKYLSQCIKSVLNQSYQNLEIIFWDNKSTDNSKNIIKSFYDKRIKYFFSSEHTTLYKARNLALKSCNGDFVCFLDVDDYFLKNKIEKQIIYFKDKDVGVVYSNYYCYYEKIKKKTLLTKIKLPTGNLIQKILEDSKISFMTVMIRKETLDLLKFNFNSKYSIIGDYDLLFRLSYKCKFFYIHQPLAVYRVHDDNLSKNLKLFLAELKNWYNKNSFFFINKKNYVYKKIIYFEALNFLSEKKILKFLKKLWHYPFSLNKIKLLLIFILPDFLLEFVKKFKKS